MSSPTIRVIAPLLRPDSVREIGPAGRALLSEQAQDEAPIQRTYRALITLCRHECSRLT